MAEELRCAAELRTLRCGQQVAAQARGVALQSGRFCAALSGSGCLVEARAALLSEDVGGFLVPDGRFSWCLLTFLTPLPASLGMRGASLSTL